jgi:hypothetical protein
MPGKRKAFFVTRTRVIKADKRADERLWAELSEHPVAFCRESQ